MGEKEREHRRVAGGVLMAVEMHTLTMTIGKLYCTRVLQSITIGGNLVNDTWNLSCFIQLHVNLNYFEIKSVSKDRVLSN